MEENNQSFLAQEKTGKLMAKYAVPCIISLLVGALYNIVDQIFIANADYLGSYGNAANTVVFPLTVIALAVAAMAAINNMIRKYSASDPVFSQEQYAQIPMGGCRHSDEILSNRHFHRRRYGGGLYPDCRVQQRRGA